MNNDLQTALDNFRCNATKYTKFQRYYDGNHDLAFATEKFQNTFGNLFREFALNLCPVVCDAVRDKLRISSVSSPTVSEGVVFRYGERPYVTCGLLTRVRHLVPQPHGPAFGRGA